MRILVVSEDNPKSQHLKHLIRKLDKEYSVDRSDKPRSTYYRKDLKRLDIIFVDVAIQNPKIDEFIDMMQKRLYQSKSKATFCIMANSFTKESLANLKEKGITHLLVTNIPDKELLEHLRDIINIVNE